MDWVILAHERALSPAESAALEDWLAAAPAHRHAHNDAIRLWLLSGLTPPVSGLPPQD